MWLEKLELTGFRSYEKTSVDFQKRLVFITGLNASGKTNILEAVSLLSLGKSFRGAADRDLVRHGQTSYHVAGRFRKNGSITELEYAFISEPESRKRIKINGKAITGRAGLIGNLITVIFSPSDLRIIEGGPADRRRFIDILLSGISSEYLDNLIKYSRALRQRNVVLKKLKEKKERLDSLLVWDSEIVKYGTAVTEKRLSFSEKFRPIFSSALRSISNSADEAGLSLILSSPEESVSFSDLIKKNYYKDIAAGTTTAGPHRHNLEFTVASGGQSFKDLLTTGSQGQKRSTALALRIAEFYYLRENLKTPPLLLIDDVIRELDAGRRAAFIRLLHECGQAVFTTPDLDGLDDFLESLKEDIQIIKITPDHQVVL